MFLLDTNICVFLMKNTSAVTRKNILPHKVVTICTQYGTYS